MPLHVLGINHESAPVEVREKVAISSFKLKDALTFFKQSLPPSSEVVLISTCNRVEIIAFLPEGVNAREALTNCLASFHQLPLEELKPFLYHYEEKEVVEHLFKVTSSLDSMVVGEAEILGQVKEAYLQALEADSSGKSLNTLFQRSFGVAKAIRSSTEIGQGRVSVASVAVDFAEKVFQDLSDKVIFLLGAGEMSELCLKHLMARGAKSIIVSNRTYAKAEELAFMYSGKAIRFDLLYDYLPQADILISSTASPHYVLYPEHFQKALHQRRFRPIIIIDIAVPRDVHPDVGKLDGIYLYDIDDLKQVVEKNFTERQKELEKALTMVEQETLKFMSFYKGLQAGPVIKNLHESLHQIRQEELQKTLSKLPSLSEKERQEIEYLTERIVNKILSQPSRALKTGAKDTKGLHIIEAVKALFGLKEGGESSSEEK